MFRVHQFNKVEMFVYQRPEDSWAEHERLLAIEESLMQELGVPYRVVNVAAGDLGDPAAKKYDIEAWFPSQERYREVTSCSNTTDFQARRLGIRFRGEHGLEPVHTLNGTATVDRVALAILENFQGEVPGGPAGVRRPRYRHPLGGVPEETGEPVVPPLAPPSARALRRPPELRRGKAAAPRC